MAFFQFGCIRLSVSAPSALPRQQDNRFNTILFFQTQIKVFTNQWELKFDGLNPSSIRLAFLIYMNFGNNQLLIHLFSKLAFMSSCHISVFTTVV